MTFLLHLRANALIDRRNFPDNLPVVIRGQSPGRSVLLAKCERSDVDSGIDVPVMGGVALDTLPFPVAQLQLAIDVATTRTHLGGRVESTDHPDVLAVPLRLVLYLTAQLAQSCVPNRPIEGFAPRGAGQHRCNGQVLDTERGGLVLAHQMAADLVEVVVADERDALMDKGDSHPSFVPILGAFDLARKAALPDLESAHVALQGLGISEALAIRGDHEVFNPEIETKSFGFLGRRRDWLSHSIVHQDRGVVFPSGSPTDGGGFDLSGKLTAKTTSDALLESGQFHSLSAEINFGILRELERLVIAVTRLEGGKFGDPLEESCVGSVQIAQGSLKRRRWNLIKPSSFLSFFQLWKMGLKLVYGYVRPSLHIPI